MLNLQTEQIECPYCGETIEVLVDCSVEKQEYIEDCSVCCRPIVFSVIAEASEGINIDARAEND
jgi:hypothetical protein